MMYRFFCLKPPGGGGSASLVDLNTILVPAGLLLGKALLKPPAVSFLYCGSSPDASKMAWISSRLSALNAGPTQTYRSGFHAVEKTLFGRLHCEFYQYNRMH
jgi:hypothetical protein